MIYYMYNLYENKNKCILQLKYSFTCHVKPFHARLYESKSFGCEPLSVYCHIKVKESLKTSSDCRIKRFFFTERHCVSFCYHSNKFLLPLQSDVRQDEILPTICIGMMLYSDRHMYAMINLPRPVAILLKF